MSKIKALISACLMGEHCRYDGRDKIAAALEKLKLEYDFIPVCPEVLGGLSTPREKANMVQGDGVFSEGASVLDGDARVLTETGKDVTAEFLDGASKAVETLDKNQARIAFLKSRSPSCGFGKLSTSEGIKPGNGVLAEMLLRKGIQVVETDW